MSYDVYGIGNALVDMEFVVSDDFLNQNNIEKGLMTLIDEKRRNELLNALNISQAKRQCGGSAANTMIAISQLGASSFYSCKIANDEFGKFYLDDIQNNRVKTNNTNENLPEGITGKCMVLVTPDAERSMNTFLGITETFSEDNLNYQDLEKAKWLYIEGYLVASPTGVDAAVKAINFAREKNIKTSLTLSDLNMVNYFKDNFFKILDNKKTDLLFCNEQEAMGFTEKSSLEDAIEKLKDFSDRFVITRGKLGALYFNGEKNVYIDAKKVDPIDTNGAGDLFAGAFLYGINKGFTDEASLKLAVEACSILITQYGARLDKKQIEKIKEKMELK